MSNDKQRQQRKAAKQQRRNARKSEPAAARQTPSSAMAQQKMSDVLSAFAAPLAALAGELDPALLRQLLVTAAGVWNAQLASPAFGALLPPSAREVSTLAARLGVTEAQVQAVLSRLPARKRTLFHADTRAFTDVETFWAQGEIRVRVQGLGSPAVPSRTAFTGLLADMRIKTVFEHLRRTKFDNEACEAAAAELADVKDRVALALSLIDMYLDATLKLDPTEIWRFAAAVAYIAGGDAAQQGYKRSASSGGVTRPKIWGLLGTALGSDALGDLPEGSSDELKAAAQAIVSKLTPGVTRVAGVLGAVNLLPPKEASSYARLLLAMLADTPDQATFASWGALTPFALPVREVFFEHLALHGREALARIIEAGLDATTRPAALRLLDGTPPSTVPQRALPVDWFVAGAYATLPDGSGAQVVYLERILNLEGQRAYVCGVVSDRRGLFEFYGFLDHDPREQELKELALWPVEAGYAEALLVAGVLRATALGSPLPLGYGTFGAFLTGFADVVGPDVVAIADDLYDPELLPHTGALWHYDSFSDAFLLSPVTRAGRKLIDACREVGRDLPEDPAGVTVAFPRRITRELDNPFNWPVDAAGLAAVDLAAKPLLDAVFTSEARALWRGRLQQATYLLDHAGLRALAELAATAAQALGSALPLSEQPFIRDMVRVLGLFD